MFFDKQVWKRRYIYFEFFGEEIFWNELVIDRIFKVTWNDVLWQTILIRKIYRFRILLKRNFLEELIDRVKRYSLTILIRKIYRFRILQRRNFLEELVIDRIQNNVSYSKQYSLTNNFEKEDIYIYIFRILRRRKFLEKLVIDRIFKVTMFFDKQFC